MRDLDREIRDRAFGGTPAAGGSRPARPKPASSPKPSSSRKLASGRNVASSRPATPARPRTLEARDEGVAADTLQNYLRSIGSIPVLSRDETYDLARSIEKEERTFRDAMFAIPATSLAVLERWHERREAGRVTAALSAGYRDGSGKDWSRHIDLRLRKLERLAEERAEQLRAGSQRAKRRVEALDADMAKALDQSGIAFEVVIEIYREFQEHRQVPRVRRRLGLGAPAVRAQLARAEEALARLDETKQIFVTHNLKLVVKHAKRYRNMGVPFIDLIQEGNLGLIRAVEKFDWRRGFRFSTYAVWWIEQALIRAIQNSSRTVRVPSHIYELQLRLRRVQAELRQRLGRTPRRQELAEALEVAPEILDRVAASTKPIASTHAVLPGTDEFTLEDVLADEEAANPVECIDHAEVRSKLERLLGTLEPREQRILEWRFGLAGDEPVTLEIIGRRLGLSRERVRQIEARALARLRLEGDARRLGASLDLPGDLPELPDLPDDEEAALEMVAALH